MPLWIPITVSAALFQCWRTAMQQKLRNLLSVNGAGFVRYLYGCPASFVLFVGPLLGPGRPAPGADAGQSISNEERTHVVRQAHARRCEV